MQTNGPEAVGLRARFLPDPPRGCFGEIITQLVLLAALIDDARLGARTCPLIATSAASRPTAAPRKPLLAALVEASAGACTRRDCPD